MSVQKIPIDLSNAEFEKDYEFPKSKYFLPSHFKETNLGYPNGSSKQYRGPSNQHVKEYDIYYIGHRDHADPRRDPFGHIVKDAPESLIAILAGSILGMILGFLLFKWKEQKDLKDRRILRKFIIYIIAALVFVLLVTIGLVYLGKFIRESRRERISM